MYVSVDHVNPGKFSVERSSTQNESRREENEEKKREDAAKEHSKKLDIEQDTSIRQPCISGPTIPGTSGTLLPRVLYIQNYSYFSN